MLEQSVTLGYLLLWRYVWLFVILDAFIKLAISRKETNRSAFSKLWLPTTVLKAWNRLSRNASLIFCIFLTILAINGQRQFFTDACRWAKFFVSFRDSLWVVSRLHFGAPSPFYLAWSQFALKRYNATIKFMTCWGEIFETAILTLLKLCKYAVMNADNLRHHFSAEYEQANDTLCVLTLEYLQRIKLTSPFCPFFMYLLVRGYTKRTVYLFDCNRCTIWW